MEKFYQNIESYLLGELSPSDLAAFEKAVQADAALASSVELHRDLQQRLEALRLRNKVKASLEGQAGQARSGWVLAAIVTITSLLAISLWIVNRPDKTIPEILEQHPPMLSPDTLKTRRETPPPPIAEEPREKLQENSRWIALAREMQERPSQTMVRDALPSDSSTEIKTPLETATEAFFAQKFQLAANLLHNDNLVKEDDIARFVRASARFNIGQYASAASDFDALGNSFQFKHEARWNFMLCQLALGKLSRSKALLDNMAADADYPFRDKALALQKKLSS